MAHWLTTICLLLTTGTVPVDTLFVQVSPPRNTAIARTPGQIRAVVLIEGLELHPLDHKRGSQADLRPWQQPGSPLVKGLTPDADIFAFSFGQSATVSDIASLPALGESIQRLHQAGYAEVILIGYSAGGVVARQFVEDNPGAGVTRVIQVCTPNLGSALAKVKSTVGPAQESFLQSLTSQARIRTLQERRTRFIPAEVEFVCVVGNGLVYGDGVVSTRSQWPEDLQAQGVPAVIISTEHWDALRGDRSLQSIARLVRENQPRWDAAHVTAMRKRLWPTAKSIFGD